MMVEKPPHRRMIGETESHETVSRPSWEVLEEQWFLRRELMANGKSAGTVWRAEP